MTVPNFLSKAFYSQDSGREGGEVGHYVPPYSPEAKSDKNTLSR